MGTHIKSGKSHGCSQMNCQSVYSTDAQTRLWREKPQFCLLSLAMSYELKVFTPLVSVNWFQLQYFILLLLLTFSFINLNGANCKMLQYSILLLAKTALRFAQKNSENTSSTAGSLRNGRLRLVASTWFLILFDLQFI